jgi:hypothetical protein
MHQLPPIDSFLAVCLIAVVTSCATTNTDRPPSHSRRIDSGSYASLGNGRIRVVGNPKHLERFDAAAEIQLAKLNAGPTDYLEAITSKTGAGEITYVSVPDTFYSFILLDGAVQPLILDTEKWEVWQVAGLGKYFSRCRIIGTDPRLMSFGGVKGLADTWLGWSFDFADRKRGLVVSFTAEGAW